MELVTQGSTPVPAEQLLCEAAIPEGNNPDPPRAGPGAPPMVLVAPPWSLWSPQGPRGPLSSSGYPFHGSTMNQDLGQHGKGTAWRGRGSCWVLLHSCLGLLHSCLRFLHSHLGSPALPPCFSCTPSPPQPGQAGICPQWTIPGVLSRKGGQSLPGSSGCSLSLGHPGTSWITSPLDHFPVFMGRFFPGTGGVQFYVEVIQAALLIPAGMRS